MRNMSIFLFSMLYYSLVFYPGMQIIMFLCVFMKSSSSINFRGSSSVESMKPVAL